MSEMNKWLELQASYKAHITELENMIINEVTENIFTSAPSSEEIKRYLHNQRIRNYISNCRNAYESLGLRRGEQAKSWWLERLDPKEKQVFLLAFEQKRKFSEIARLIGMEQRDVRKNFDSSVRKVISLVTGVIIDNQL